MRISMNTLIRTMRLKVSSIAATKKVLLETITAYTASFNRVSRIAWDGRISNGVDLHHKTYYAERELTKLPSQLTISARMKATEALKSVKKLTKKAETENKKIALENAKLETNGKRLRKLKKLPGCPLSKSQAMRFDARSHTLDLQAGWATVVTLQGRKRLEFTVPKFWATVAQWRSTSADLCVDRTGQLWLHVVMQKEVTEVAATGDVIGIDLGQVNPVSDSNGKFYGNPHWATVERRRKSHVSRLQRKGTKSARRRLKKLSGTRNRFRADCDHVISRQLVNTLQAGDTLVFEDLVNIRGNSRKGKEQRERLHTWSFDRLQFYVSYKALERGIAVDFVDPRYTSQKCNKCGQIDRGNRATQSGFTCLSCGHSDNADVNAAKNIRDDFVRSRAVVNQPLVGLDADRLSLTGKPRN